MNKRCQFRAEPSSVAASPGCSYRRPFFWGVTLIKAVLPGTEQSRQPGRGWQRDRCRALLRAAPGAGGARGKRQQQRLLRRGGRRMFCSFQTRFYRQGNARHGCLGVVRDSECSVRSRFCHPSGTEPPYRCRWCPPRQLPSSPVVSDWGSTDRTVSSC